MFRLARGRSLFCFSKGGIGLFGVVLRFGDGVLTSAPSALRKRGVG